MGVLDAFALFVRELGVEVEGRGERSNAGDPKLTALFDGRSQRGAPSATISIGAPSRRLTSSRPRVHKSSKDSRIPSVTESGTRSGGSLRSRLKDQAPVTPSSAQDW